jgi:hypothetical protein
VVLAVLDMIGQLKASRWTLAFIAAGAAGVAGYDWLNVSQRLGEVEASSHMLRSGSASRWQHLEGFSRSSVRSSDRASGSRK